MKIANTASSVLFGGAIVGGAAAFRVALGVSAFAARSSVTLAAAAIKNAPTASKAASTSFLGGGPLITLNPDKKLEGLEVLKGIQVNPTLRKRIFQGSLLMAGISGLSMISKSHDPRIRIDDNTHYTNPPDFDASTMGLPLAMYYNNK